MRATSTFSDTSATKAVVVAPPAPFALEFVTITKQQHIELKMASVHWQRFHRLALAKCDRQEVRYDRIVRELKAQALKSNAALQAKLDLALAQVRDLQMRLFSSKSEQSRPSESRSEAASCRKRGQQRGTIGHGRTIEAQLSERHEDVVLDKAQCPECGLAFKEFAGTEDTQVLEIEVKAYRRVIHRHRYMPTCQCGCVSGIVTAASPARLIERGKFGISVWTSVLLDKFAYGRPSQRLLQDLADHGLNMAPGTLAGGLQAIAPLFKPLDDALRSKLRTEPYWHADETRWAVFIEILGKVGHRWYMWVFQSCSVIHYVVDKSGADEVKKSSSLNFIIPMLITAIVTVATAEALYGVIMGLVTCLVMFVPQRLMKFWAMWDGLVEGFKDMMFVIMLIAMAFRPALSIMMFSKFISGTMFH